jgi:predicted PurR-regulated permease PerM
VTADDGPAQPAPVDAATPRASSPPGARATPPPALSRAGRAAWALVGIALVLVFAWYVASALALVLVPVVLALFPATLLSPIADALCRRGVPPTVAALVTVVGALLVFLGILAGVIALVVAQIPELMESAAEGVRQIESLLASDPLGLGVERFSDVLEMAREQLGQAGDLAAQAVSAALVAFEFLAGLLLLLVALFFYLKDGRRLRDAIVSTAPRRRRPLVRASLDRAWTTLAGYIRGQVIVAAVDAVFIGAGLLILGVPLAVPLAVLVFFGAMFPIVGAVTTGALAVLVALADGGLTDALIVLAIVVAVQQLEGNVLEPFILGRAISLHPLVVLLAVTGGAVVLGILGAFLAVPLTAIAARIIELLRDPELIQETTDAA